MRQAWVCPLNRFESKRLVFPELFRRCITRHKIGVAIKKLLKKWSLRPGLVPRKTALPSLIFPSPVNNPETIAVSGSKVSLLPAGSWDIEGGPEPESWTYRIDVFGASIHRTEFAEAAGLLHFRYATDPGVPWVGLSPLSYARDTGKLAAALEKRLGEEASAPVGNLLPIPDVEKDEGDDSNSSPLATLKSDLRNARGRTLLVPTTAAGFGEGMAAAPRQDWKQQRLGADPPDALEKIRGAVSETVLACCGVPVELAELGQGTAAREAWRRFLHATIDPLGKIVAEELSEKFEFPVTLSFENLMASDIVGRARAFQSMVGGGMDPAKAAGLSGLMMTEEP